MENFLQSIQTLQKHLLDANIRSIVIGGIAVAIWGEPRVTRDVDLKILLDRQEADRLLELLSSDYQPLVSGPREALRKQAMIFVQDSLGTRLDLLLADTPYDITAIKRGRDMEMEPGFMIHVCSPEDLIIYKLISTRLRDHEDVRSIVRRQRNALDHKYVINWLRQFEQALDDSTLVAEYQSLQQKYV